MKKENIFIWNNSAVTNAIITALEKSNCINNIYYANPKTKILSTKPILLKTDGFELIKEMQKLGIKYVFSNSEANDNKLINAARKHKFSVIGADFKGTKLESSKIFTKQLMDKYNINTAKYCIVEKFSQIKSIKNDLELPVIIKADGYAWSLSAKKIDNFKELKTTIKKYLNGYYGNSSKKIIIEEYIKGKELSIPLVLDGKIIKMLMPVKDYKTRDKSSDSPNTGGMGCIAPIQLSEQELLLLNNLIQKLEILLTEENLFYKGFMTINVIFTDREIYLLEINTRLGDSEGQTILELIDFDLMELFIALDEGNLNEYNFNFKKEYSASVNIINKSYPRINNKKAFINKKSLNNIKLNSAKIFFYKNVKENKNYYIQDNNRFLSIVATGNSIKDVRKTIYTSIEQIEGKNIFYRKDIGLE